MKRVGSKVLAAVVIVGAYLRTESGNMFASTEVTESVFGVTAVKLTAGSVSNLRRGAW